MNEMFLFEEEQFVNQKQLKDKKGSQIFDTLSILISTYVIFQRMVNNADNVTNLISTKHNPKDRYDESQFDIDDSENEDELCFDDSECNSTSSNVDDDNVSETDSFYSVDSGFDNANSDTDSFYSTQSDMNDVAISQEEKAIVGAVSFALLMSYKLQHDTTQIHVFDLFEAFSTVYTRLFFKLNKTIDYDRYLLAQHWQENDEAYESLIDSLKSQFKPLSLEERRLLAQMGSTLPNYLKIEFQSHFEQIKLLTSFLYYNERNIFSFELTRIESNAVRTLYDRLPAPRSLTECYQFIENLHYFTKGKELPYAEPTFSAAACAALPPARSLKQPCTLEYLWELFQLPRPNPLYMQSDPHEYSEGRRFRRYSQ
jgi:hypothetical protein